MISMVQSIAFLATCTAWLACVFTMLQLTEPGRRRGLVGLLLVLVAGVAVVLVRGSDIGIEWLRRQELRSDAFALTALIAAVATAVGVSINSGTRHARWSALSSTAAALACAVAGIAAMVIGRSGWYWEFVAVIVPGALLLGIGAATTLRQGQSPNMRIVFGTVATFGGFLAVGGTALLVAWRAIA